MMSKTSRCWVLFLSLIFLVKCFNKQVRICAKENLGMNEEQVLSCTAYLSHCIHFSSIKKLARPNKTVIMKEVALNFKSTPSKGMYLYSGSSCERTPSGHKKKVSITGAHHLQECKNTEFVWELRKILQRHL